MLCRDQECVDIVQCTLSKIYLHIYKVGFLIFDSILLCNKRKVVNGLVNRAIFLKEILKIVLFFSNFLVNNLSISGN